MRTYALISSAVGVWRWERYCKRDVKAVFCLLWSDTPRVRGEEGAMPLRSESRPCTVSALILVRLGKAIGGEMRTSRRN